MSHRTRLRIVTLLATPLDHEAGGVNAFVAGLLEALQETYSADFILVAPERPRAGAGQHLGQLLLAFEQLVRLIRIKPDVVHNHEHPVLLGAAVLYRLLFRRSARVVQTFHIDPANPTTLGKRLVFGWLLARCTTITVVAAELSRSLWKVAQPTPQLEALKVIHGGGKMADRGDHDPALVQFRSRHGLGGGPFLVQVSRLHFERKVAGINRLIAAFKLVHERFPTAHLLIVGSGRLAGDVVAAVARAGLREAVTLTGLMTDPSVPMALADVHCHISFQDACPISILEAMSLGKPVVASRTGGIPELIVDQVDGVLVGPDETEIAAAIVDLLEHPEKARAIGARAKEVAHARFTWERVATDFANVYGLGAESART